MRALPPNWKLGPVKVLFSIRTPSTANSNLSLAVIVTSKLCHRLSLRFLLPSSKVRSLQGEKKYFGNVLVLNKQNEIGNITGVHVRIDLKRRHKTHVVTNCTLHPTRSKAWCSRINHN